MPKYRAEVLFENLILLEKEMLARTIFRLFLIIVVLVQQLTGGISFRDCRADMPVAGGSPGGNTAPSNTGSKLDPASIVVVEQSNVLLRYSFDGDLLMISSLPIDSSLPYSLMMYAVSLDGETSTLFNCTNGNLQTTTFSIANSTNLAYEMNSRNPGNSSGYWDGFWGNYVHYLTNPWEMDDDLEYTFYGAVGTAAVAGGAAGGLWIAGVNPVIWGSGAAVAGGAAAGGGAATGGGAGGGAASLWVLEAEAAWAEGVALELEATLLYEELATATTVFAQQEIRREIVVLIAESESFFAYYRWVLTLL